MVRGKEEQATMSPLYLAPHFIGMPRAGQDVDKIFALPYDYECLVLALVAKATATTCRDVATNRSIANRI